MNLEGRMQSIEKIESKQKEMKETTKPSVKTKAKLLGRLSSIENPIAQFIILCFCVAIQNTINSSNTAILTTIERAYVMTTVETAVFLVLHDISNVVASKQA